MINAFSVEALERAWPWAARLLEAHMSPESDTYTRELGVVLTEMFADADQDELATRFASVLYLTTLVVAATEKTAEQAKVKIHRKAVMDIAVGLALKEHAAFAARDLVAWERDVDARYTEWPEDAQDAEDG